MNFYEVKCAACGKHFPCSESDLSLKTNLPDHPFAIAVCPFCKITNQVRVLTTIKFEMV